METLRLKTGLISIDKPQVIDDLRNGQSTFNYNHNIKEVEVEQNAGNTEAGEGEGSEPKKVKSWQYDSLRVEYPRTGNNILETLLTEKYPQNQQQKLVNDYQAAQLGILEDEEADNAVASYKAFLQDRKAIKSMVKADCVTYNIPDSI